MAERKIVDPFVSTEPEISVDPEIAAAIERGLEDVKDGWIVPADEVHRLIPQWISKFSTRKQP